MLVRKFSKLNNRISVSIQFNNKSAINQCEMHSKAQLKQNKVVGCIYIHRWNQFISGSRFI